MSLIRTFEAQVVVCRHRWISFVFDDRVIRVKYGFDSASSAQGTLEHDLTLNLEYKRKGFWGIVQPVQSEIFKALEKYDNIVVEEHKIGLIFKKTIHKIVFVRRGDEILYSLKQGTGVKNPTAIRQRQEEKERILERMIERLAPYIERYLNNTKFEDATSITDEKKYKRNVVNTAWELLPFMDKLLLDRERVKWDSLFTRLREEAFSVTDNKVSVNTHVYKKYHRL